MKLVAIFALLGLACIAIDAVMLVGWAFSVIFLFLSIYFAARSTKTAVVRGALLCLALACPLGVWFLGNALSREAISEVIRNREAIYTAVVAEHPVSPTLGWASRRHFYVAGTTEIGVTLRLRIFPFRIMDIDLETGKIVLDHAID